MERNLVQVARIRAREVVIGDVVNRLADEQKGWFAVGVIDNLFDGTIAFSSTDRKLSFGASPLDIVAVQTLKPINIEVTELDEERAAEARDEERAMEAEAEAEEAAVEAAEAAKPTPEPTADPERAAEADRARQALLARMGQ